jgi:two-component system, chemotaxis family, chemotaxis protein CheY
MLRIDVHRLRFLVVDNGAHTRQLLRSLLHGFGVREIREAEDGGAGFDAFTDYEPDIVLTDYSLPTIDGLELTRMIRGSENNPFVPIILCTNRTERAFVAAARDAGITEFLAKPFSAKSLYERIINVVVNPRPFIKNRIYAGPSRRRNAAVKPNGPERRRGDRAEVKLVQPLLEKARILD